MVKRALLIFLGILCLSACTRPERAAPDELAYENDSKLMIEICNKFTHEPDAKRLHKAAQATQYARVISCSDFNGECGLYGSCLSLAIKVSENGSVSSSGRAQMEEKLSELKKAVAGGRKKLRALRKR